MLVHVPLHRVSAHTLRYHPSDLTPRPFSTKKQKIRGEGSWSSSHTGSYKKAAENQGTVAKKENGHMYGGVGAGMENLCEYWYSALTSFFIHHCPDWPLRAAYQHVSTDWNARTHCD